MTPTIALLCSALRRVSRIMFAFTQQLLQLDPPLRRSGVRRVIAVAMKSCSNKRKFQHEIKRACAASGNQCALTSFSSPIDSAQREWLASASTWPGLQPNAATCLYVLCGKGAGAWVVGGSKSAAVCHVKRDSFSPKANTALLHKRSWTWEIHWNVLFWIKDKVLKSKL